jgi:molecular chaperone GrpE
MTYGNGKSNPEELDLEHELPPADEAGESAASVATLESELQRVKAERDALLDRVARAQAEFDNARKRAAREQQDYREYALADAIKTLLPILDSFDSALQSQSSGEEFRSGLELIDRQFHDALAKLGVSEIDAEGKPFDPNVHQAVQMVDTDEAEDNQVLEQLQRGYNLKGRLLRPAMVRVARNSGA